MYHKHMQKSSKKMCIIIIFIFLPSFAGYNSTMCCTVIRSIYNYNIFEYEHNLGCPVRM